MTNKKRAFGYFGIVLFFCLGIGSIVMLQTLNQMGDHRMKIQTFWGALYDPKSLEEDNKRLEENPPETLKEELEWLFTRIYRTPGGPYISKQLVNVCLENEVDLLPLYVSPKGEMTVLCGIDEPYEVLPVSLPDSLPSGLIVMLSETKPNYFDPGILAEHKLIADSSEVFGKN